MSSDHHPSMVLYNILQWEQAECVVIGDAEG